MDKQKSRRLAMSILAITNHNGIRIAEVGFLLGAIGGAIVALGAFIPLMRVWNFLAGVALAGSFVLLIVATHWGHYG
jgi:hypothetical protein